MPRVCNVYILATGKNRKCSKTVITGFHKEVIFEKREKSMELGHCLILQQSAFQTLLPSKPSFHHLCQLNSQLLSVVHEDAGLQMGKEEGVRAQDLSPGPPPRASLTPPLPGTSDGYRVCVWRKLGSQ